MSFLFPVLLGIFAIAMDKSDLYKLAYKVRDAKDLHENTASRVGNLFVGIIDHLGDQQAIFDTLNAVANDLTTDINKKLDKATFDDLFEKVNLGTESSPVWSIRAKYGLWTEEFLSAKGRPLKLPNGDEITGRLDAWDMYSPDTAEWVLSAKLGYQLYTTQNSLLSRVAALEATPGLDTDALAQYLTTNNYAKKSDIPVIDLSPYLKSADAAQTYQPKGNYLTQHQDISGKVDKVAGMGLSHNDFTDALLSKLNGIADGANKYVHPAHTVRNIAAAAGLVLASVSVDAQGHVTDVAAKTLTQSDIPVLAIDKVSGLQSSLDSKLSSAAFDDLFEKVNLGTAAAPVWSIKAKYGVWTEDFLSAKGRPLKLPNGDNITDRLDYWSDYGADKATWVLSAKLGYGLYTTQSNLLSRVSALEATPGLDTAALQQYLTVNNYAKKSDIPAAVDLSPYLAKTEAAQLYQPKGNYLTAHQDLSAYAKKADAVTALGVSGNSLTWTKNGAVNSLTVPYAASSGQGGYLFTGGSVDPDTVETGTKLAFYSGISAASPNIPTFVGWQNALINIGLHGINTAAQLYVSSGSSLYFRSSKTSAWRTILDSSNYAGVLGSVYQAKGDYVTRTTAQEISGVKTFTNEVVATSRWITARIITGEDGSGNSTAQTKKAHSIELGYPNKDYMNFNEYGGVFNFYKTNTAFSSTGDGTLVAKISEAGVTAASFVKSGGTASQVLMADGSVKTVHTLGAVTNLGWGATAGQIPTINTLAFWNGAYSGTSSNLAYCNKGAFGTIVTMGSTQYARALTSSEVLAGDMNEMFSNKIFLGSGNFTANTPNGNGWYNVIQVSHRNAEDDGLNYVGQIALGMTVNHEQMYFRTHRTRTWQHVLTEQNYSSVLDGRYYTESEADSRFVNAAGDTMTGMFSAPHISVAGMYWNNTGIMPADAGNNLYTCGKPAGRWANVYATTINVTSTALVANLNADLLDGLHASSFGRTLSNTSTNANDVNSLNGLWGGKLFNATNVPYTYYAFLHFGYGDYYGQFNAYNNQLQFRAGSESSGTPSWRIVAFTDSNVASATKLQTARTLWGQSFDGTANVDGTIHIRPSTSNYTEGLRIHQSTDGNWAAIMLCGKDNTGNSGTSNGTWGIFTNPNYDLFINRGNSDSHTGYEFCNIGGNWGIGTTAPAYKLDVNGSAIFTNWVRVRGTDGIYFESYGGGWHMQDSTWIRGYNGKSLYMGGGQIRTDYLFNREGYVGASWDHGYGAYNVSIGNNGNQTPLMVAYRSGYAPDVTGANRLFAMELLNNGTLLRFGFGGTMTHELLSNGNFHATGAIWSDGALSGKGSPSGSDERMKRDINDIILPMDVLLGAPAVSFYWRDGEDPAQRAGTIAQYWLKHLPQVVYTRPDNGMYCVDYGPLAHIELHSLAVHVGDELTAAKREIKRLQERVSVLERRLNAA